LAGRLYRRKGLLRLGWYRKQEIAKSGIAMHYPHKSSKIKRARSIGFRARMRTKKGRQMINRKRRVGRTVNVV
jgi:large subunit ribosomal protein L34